MTMKNFFPVLALICKRALNSDVVFSRIQSGNASLSSSNWRITSVLAYFVNEKGIGYIDARITEQLMTVILVKTA